MKLRIGCVVVGFLSLILSLAAQTSGSGPASAQVPPLIQFSNVATDEGGNTLSGMVSITFSLYNAQQGGEPLWTETQNNVQLDPTGHYSVQLGITKPNGVPTTLFTTGEARWLGVQIAEQVEQPRVLLLSVPYALKAGDAATVGGLPPSAFVLAAPPSGSSGTELAITASALSGVSPEVAGTGTADYIPLWTNSTGTLGDSALFQSGTGSTAKIGINTTTPASTLDVTGGGTIRGTLSLPPTGTATATAGKNSQPLNLSASAFNGSAAVNQTFRWQAEPAGNDSAVPSGTLNLLFAEGTAAPTETGLHVASNGHITFATGQTFPGTGTGDGTVTSVGSGAGLKGGPITASGTLSIDTTKVPLLAANNTFTGTQTIHNTTIISGTNSAGVLQVTNTATSGKAPAIVGTTDSSAAAGIKGIVTATSGTEAGVVGSTSSAEGDGVQGLSPYVGVYGLTTGIPSSSSDVLAGVHGVASFFSADEAGIAGTGSTISSTGSALGGAAGVWGDTAVGNAGVTGTADDAYAGTFYNESNDFSTLYLQNLGTGGTGAATLVAQGQSGVCSMDTGGNLGCSGEVITAAGVDNGARKVALYSMQSPENWFEDFGSGTLRNGAASIALDPTFAQTVNTGTEYHVFLTPNGDCKGLYVSQKSAGSFEIRELGGGHSSVAFDYRIVAKRNGYEKVRLTDVTEQYKKMEEQRELRHARAGQRPARSSSVPQTIPMTQIPQLKAAVQPATGQSK